MATPNLQVIIQMVIAVTNNLLANAPQIITFDLGNPTLGAATVFYDPYFQFTNVLTNVPLPAPKVYAVLVQNNTSNNIQVGFTPFGFPASAQNLGPGGVFMYVDPAEVNGFSALSLTDLGGASGSALVLVAA